MAYTAAELDSILNEYAERIWLDSKLPKLSETEGVARVRRILDQVFELADDSSIQHQTLQDIKACRVLLVQTEEPV